MGEDEIKLVEKKLKWAYKPFEIPNKIIEDGEILTKCIKKAHLNQKNINIFSALA